MPIIYKNKTIELSEEQSVLAALLNKAYDIPHSCQTGVCQTCIMRAEEGEIPAEAQVGLKDTLKQQGYFLACRCKPVGTLRIHDAESAAVRTPATVVDYYLFNSDTLRLRLRPNKPFEYRPGQYVTLWNPQNVGRSYSLAGVPEVDDYLEMHIRFHPKGKMSSWLEHKLNPGDTLQLQTAAGECFYVPGNPAQSMLLSGTGTGLAPLFGIARDALQRGHQGEIHLVHGALREDGLYLHETLEDLAQQYDNFYYHPCVLEGENIPEIPTIPIEDLTLEIAPQPIDWKIYLCGSEFIVNKLRKKLFLAGASIKNIYSDSFVYAHRI